MTWTNAQAEAIASELEGKGLAGAKCYVGMRYWHPFTEAALEAIEKDGITALVSLGQRDRCGDCCITGGGFWKRECELREKASSREARRYVC